MEVIDEENESFSCPRETISLGSTTGADGHGQHLEGNLEI